MLPDNEIIELVKLNRIEGVRPGYDALTSESAVQPGSLDLHIGGIFVPGVTAGAAGGESHPHDDYLLSTGQTVLVKTREFLRLPKDIGGLAFPPSSFAVKALLVTNAGHVDPEYSGPLRFTIINMGHEPQKLEIGQRVGTLVLFETTRPVSRGWKTRTGKPGRSPNTNDLHYLCPDFLDIKKRATEIAKAEVEGVQRNLNAIEQRLSRKFNLTTFAASLLVATAFAVFSIWSPVSKLDTKVELLNQQVQKASDVDQKIQKIPNRDDIDQIIKKLDSMDKRITTVEKKLR